MIELIEREGLSNYSDFVDYLVKTSNNFAQGQISLSNNKHEIESLINGTNAKAISKFLDNTVRKDQGIFFTSEHLAEKVAKRLKNELQQGKSIYDPACGAGDLFLACIKLMPQKETITETLSYWSSKIFGQDLAADFVRSAQARLVISSLYLYSIEKKRHLIINKKNFFENIIVNDFFEDSSIIQRADCIVTNPPYGNVDLTGKVAWARGKGQLAALFLDHIINASKDGQRVVAILPDVLRSGSRYGKWRAFINSNSNNLNTEICGKFNNEADVDVFILDFIISKNSLPENITTFDIHSGIKGTKSKMSDYFNISVGPVVPHRDEQIGELSPYIDTRNAKLWEEVTPRNKKKYKCTLKKPPFIALRRTSSPADKPRLKVSIIKGTKSVSVENHLIVMEPKDGKLQTCREFLRVAKSIEANDWTNQKIRCRHLTVSAIREMPIFDFKIS